MNIHEEFKDFLRLLADREVEFVVVGGYAVAFHGYVRATQDIDLLFRNTESNATQIMLSLADFGLPVDAKVFEDLRESGNIIRIGFPPVRIELLNEISGVSFDMVWERRMPGKYGDVDIFYISRQDLIANKKAAARPKDLADVDELGGNR